MEQITHPKDSKSAVWVSVEKLMLDRWGRVNLSRMARESGLALGTASRLQHGNDDGSIGLDKVEKIAALFNVEPWQLLDPNFDPKKSPVGLSSQARELASAFDRITDQAARARAYALCQQVLEFAAPPLEQTPVPAAEPKQ